jgi:hypothetical protein
MLRRLIIAGLAVGLAAPIFASTPSTAAVLFSCTGFTGSATITPGLGNTQTAQTVSGSGSISGCSNGQTGSVVFGTPNLMASYPPRPLGCPTALGGAGPDYANQTPILLGANVSFTIDWASGPDSTGVAKAKSAGPTEPGNVRALLAIKNGSQYDPAKIKGKLAFTPTDSFTCVDNSDRISAVSLGLVGSLIVQT